MTHQERATIIIDSLDRDYTKLDGTWISRSEAIRFIADSLAQRERETWAGLKVTNDQLRWALKELGPTGTNAEAYIKAAVEYLIDVRAKVQP